MVNYLKIKLYMGLRAGLTLALMLVVYISGITQIVNIEDRRTNFEDTAGLYERLDLGFNFIKNDEEVISVNGDFQIEFLQDKRLFMSLTQLSFLKAGDESFVNSGLQHLRYTYHWSDYFEWEAFGQLQYNEQLSIRLRGLAGSGPRFSLDFKKKASINLGLMYMWEYDEIANSNEVHHDSRFSSYLSLHYILGVLQFASTTYFQPLFNDLQDYRVSNQSSIIIKFHEKWSLNIGFNLNYDSRLPGNVPDLVYSFSNGLRYRF